MGSVKTEKSGAWQCLELLTGLKIKDSCRTKLPINDCDQLQPLIVVKVFFIIFPTFFYQDLYHTWGGAVSQCRLCWRCISLHSYLRIEFYFRVLLNAEELYHLPVTIPHICHFTPRAQLLVKFYFTKTILYGVQESRILVVGCFGFCSSHLQCNAMQLQSINLHLHFRKRYDNCHWEGSQRLLTW